MSGEGLRQAERDRERGALAEARARCQEVLRESPDDSPALVLMAALAADERRTEEGLHWAGLALAADPESAAAHYTLGRLYQGDGRHAEAEASYRRSLALDAAQAKAHNNLGCVLQMQGKLEAAIAAFRRALELEPGLPQAQQNLAAITRDRAALEQAAEGYRRQVLAAPADAEAHTNLGNVYRELGRHAEAIASFREAIARRPELAEAHFSLSLELLLCGEYAEGWKEYEWRWKVKGLNAAMRPFRQPLWDGRELRGGTLLLHAEQGLGDTLQFVRYAQLARERCAALILECQRELVPLMRTAPGLSAVVAQGELLPRFDAHLPLMSLPAVFGTTLESIPWHGPYLQPDGAKAERWRARIAAARGRLNVGLVWAGRPQQWDDRKRSISLAMLQPLARIPGLAFFSLQKGEAAQQAAAPPAGMRVADLGAGLADFSDTAAVASQLDLVITVDTSVAHLGGALGAATWVLLSRIPDSRYHLEREDNPWYPSMRLFRQRVDGDWSTPIARLAGELARLAERP